MKEEEEEEEEKKANLAFGFIIYLFLVCSYLIRKKEALSIVQATIICNFYCNIAFWHKVSSIKIKNKKS